MIDRRWQLLTALLLLAGSWAFAALSHALPAASVGLTRFEAFPLDDAVRLEWETETELGTAGYKLKRGQDGTFDYLADPAGSGDLFILYQGGPNEGASYDFTDETALNGERYTYQLIEVEVDASEIKQAEVTVFVGATPTNTPIAVGGGLGGNGQPTATPTRSNSTATATVQAGSTSAPTASATPRAQGSPTPLRPAASPTPAALATRTAGVTANSGPSVAANVALAQAEPTQTNGYPGPEAGQTVAPPPLPSPEDADQGYPAPTVAPVDTAPPAELTPAPEGLPEGLPDVPPAVVPTDATTGLPLVIGGQDGLTNGAPGDAVAVTAEPAQQVVADEGAGQLYLWAGFIAALLVFITAVYGAILLYARRRDEV